MDTFLCEYCGQKIPDAVIAGRHYSLWKVPSRVFCNRVHQVLYRQQHGEFKQMSEQGREARVGAVRESNRVHPRKGKRQ